MWQFPPAKDGFVYKKNKLDDRSSCAPSYWTENFTIYCLTKKTRSQTDLEVGDVCNHIERGGLEETHLQYLSKQNSYSY